MHGGKVKHREVPTVLNDGELARARKELDPKDGALLSWVADSCRIVCNSIILNYLIVFFSSYDESISFIFLNAQ